MNSALRGDYTLNNSDTLTLIQVTDAHLMSEKGGRLLNVDTDDSLAAVLDLVMDHPGTPDALLITGDIAGDGASAAYERMALALGVIHAPSFWLPGNHDDCDASKIDHEHFIRTATNPHWLIVMLDSQQPDAVGGHLVATELDALSQAVDRANQEGKHLLIALHHPPQPVGCDWLDPQRIANSAAFELEVQRCRQQVVVISGHVHQESDQVIGDIRYLTTPSTCIQFAPNQVTFKVDDQAPGYRWLRLSPSGEVETGVERVIDRQFPVDLNSGGYL
jgi:Icc protein